MSDEAPPAGDWLFVVNFHHVRDNNPPAFPGFHHRTPSQLREQLDVLGRIMEFPTIPELERMIVDRTPPRSRVGMITFDDGLRDHVTVAAPVLAAVGAPAVFSVNTAPWSTGRLLPVHMAHFLSAAFSYVDLADDFVRAARAFGVDVGLADVAADRARAQYRYDDVATATVKYYLNVVVPQAVRADVLRAVFETRLGDDREHAAQHYMQPAHVRELAGAGHAIGMHTHEHLHLASTDRDRRRDDLAHNRGAITAAIGIAPTWISYPYGSPSSYDDSVIADARDAGCAFGMTMSRGVNRFPTLDPMRLLRVDTNDAIGGKSAATWRELAA